MFKINKRHFSFTHNFHSPAVIYCYGKEYIYDNTVKDYTNKYIQAFLSKTWTTKKQIRK